MKKTDEQIPGRYSRHMLFPPIGRAGQHRLMESRVVIVGMGALGSVLANHMVRAGIGYVRIIDRDIVEESNLQRQMLYDEEDAIQLVPKANAAADKLRRINSQVQIEPHVTDLHAVNAEDLLGGVDLILDGTDNFAVRFLINDVSVKHRIPWIYGGAVASRGVSLAILPGKTPCLRCLFRQAPVQGSAETCDTAGVIGGIIHVVASYQATEALKLLVGDTEHVNPSMMQWDLWYNQQSAIDVSKARRQDCPCCGEQRYDYLDAELEGETIQTLCGRNSVQVQPKIPSSLSLEEWEERLQGIGPVTRNKFLLKVELSPDFTLVVFQGGRVMVQGTDDPVTTKNLYCRYIGM
ncbi:ThiF family adenylyltransferase [Paenibacillus larvae]